MSRADRLRGHLGELVEGLSDEEMFDLYEDSLASALVDLAYSTDKFKKTVTEVIEEWLVK